MAALFSEAAELRSGLYPRMKPNNESSMVTTTTAMSTRSFQGEAGVGVSGLSSQYVFIRRSRDCYTASASDYAHVQLVAR